MTKTHLRTSILAAACVLTTAANASALPFTLTTTLTGDFRSNNPDNLFVNVTVTGDTTSNIVNWVVDINSPLHPNASLDVFAFNLSTSASSVTFSNFSPSGWGISSNANNVPGSGGADFRFEANDPPMQFNNVTNAVNLTFTARLNTGNWNESHFLNGPLSDGGGIPSPGAQLGAHLRSLSTDGCAGCSDSGFASGSWTQPTSSVPAPTTLLLSGLGLLGMGVMRRRQ